MDRTKMRPVMQLGEFKCRGSCKRVYATINSRNGHERLSRQKNEQGKPGQNGCKQPGYDF